MHYSYHSLWHAYGENYGYFDQKYTIKNTKKKSCIIIASEPLMEDTTTWLEVPEYTAIVPQHVGEDIVITSHDIDV